MSTTLKPLRPEKALIYWRTALNHRRECFNESFQQGASVVVHQLHFHLGMISIKTFSRTLTMTCQSKHVTALFALVTSISQ